MLRGNLAWLIAVPLAVVVATTLSLTAPSTTRDKDYDRVRLLVDILAEVDQHYVKEMTDDDKQRLVEDMINGGLERLDRYSTFFNTDDYRKFSAQSKGDFGGIGIHLGNDPKPAYRWSPAQWLAPPPSMLEFLPAI